MALPKSKRSSTSSWSSLPTDLLEEIFYRIPVESLVRFKPLCKQWYALLNDKRFIYKYLNLYHEQYFIRVDDKSIQLYNLKTQALSCHISTMIHCDGLLLCSCIKERRIRSGCENIVFRNQLAVWNPFLNQVKWIELSYSYSTFDVYGFGYDNVSRDNYKILRFGQEDNYVEIYEFKSKLWKSVDACFGAKIWLAQCHAVSMNGNMYWIAYRNSSIKYFILSFDFSTETFKHICCLPFKPNWFGKNNSHTVVLSCFGGDSLSLLHQDKYKKMIEVWVTKKVTDRVVLWSKYYSVTCPNLPIFYSSSDNRFLAYFIHKTNNITFWCESDFEKRYVYPINVYEMGEDEIKKQVETGRSEWSSSLFDRCYVNSVPSLVQVPE